MTGVQTCALPISLLALALTVLAFRTRNASLLHAGTAWWWLAVLPVLPLPGRTYLHYLYIPLAGCSLAVAAVWEGAVALRQSRARGKRGGGRAAWVAAFAVLIVVAAWGDVLLSVRQDLRMASTDWPLDPVVRKSEIARGAIAEVRDALSGRHARVVILIPASISHDVDLGSGRVSTETPVKHYVLQEVLDEGRSLRAFVPEVDSVVFLHDYERGYDGWLCLVNSGGSHLTSVGELPAGHARFVKAMLVSGYVGPALDYAEKALVDMPGDGLLQALRAQAAAAPTAPR